MTSRYLLGDIKHEEGVRLTAYPDPLTGGDPWTVGVGHTGPEVHKGLTITDTQADVYLRQDTDKAKADLSRNLPWWTTLDDNRQDVLVQMAFQMGIAGLLKFTRTLDSMKRHSYGQIKPTDPLGAADYMLESKWAEQTPARAGRMSSQMRSGQRAWAYMDGK